VVALAAGVLSDSTVCWGGAQDLWLLVALTSDFTLYALLYGILCMLNLELHSQAEPTPLLNSDVLTTVLWHGCTAGHQRTRHP
jgi:hypothetical protein